MPLLMILMSIMFMNSSHPIVLMLIILSQALIICVTIWLSMKLSWFSYILFLIFLGGLMVLFIYIASLASNEKFSLDFNNFNFTYIVFTAYVTMFTIYTTNTFFVYPNWTKMNLLFNEMYSHSMSYVISLTMMYLLITLIVVVKISSKYEGPLRNMIFK